METDTDTNPDSSSDSNPDSDSDPWEEGEGREQTRREEEVRWACSQERDTDSEEPDGRAEEDLDIDLLETPHAYAGANEEEEREEDPHLLLKHADLPRVAFVYCLGSSSGRYYIGATVDLNRRLRQHNRELVGGARLTTRQVARGDTWTRVAHVAGCPTWRTALQCEWKWKDLTRQLSVAGGHARSPLDIRLAALHHLLALPRATSHALPFASWPTPPRVELETPAARDAWARDPLPLPVRARRVRRRVRGRR
jgi:predicted GIY-YIG superfamily endonuclease